MGFHSRINNSIEELIQLVNSDWKVKKHTAAILPNKEKKIKKKSEKTQRSTQYSRVEPWMTAFDLVNVHAPSCTNHWSPLFLWWMCYIVFHYYGPLLWSWRTKLVFPSVCLFLSLVSLPLSRLFERLPGHHLLSSFTICRRSVMLLPPFLSWLFGWYLDRRPPGNIGAAD